MDAEGLRPDDWRGRRLPRHLLGARRCSVAQVVRTQENDATMATARLLAQARLSAAVQANRRIGFRVPLTALAERAAQGSAAQRAALPRDGRLCGQSKTSDDSNTR